MELIVIAHPRTQNSTIILAKARRPERAVYAFAIDPVIMARFINL
jgi:hypothetical protein